MITDSNVVLKECEECGCDQYFEIETDIPNATWRKEYQCMECDSVYDPEELGVDENLSKIR